MTAPIEEPQGRGTGSLGRNLLVFGSLWGVLSMVIGFVTSLIPWGQPDALRGQGWPVPVVIWDKPAGRDQYVDHSFPLAFLLNPLIFFAAGSLLAAMIYGACALVAKRRGNRPA